MVITHKTIHWHSDLPMSSHPWPPYLPTRALWLPDKLLLLDYHHVSTVHCCPNDQVKWVWTGFNHKMWQISLTYFVGQTHCSQFQAQPAVVECTCGIFHESLTVQQWRHRGRLDSAPAVEVQFFCRIYSDWSIQEAAGAQTHGTSSPCSTYTRYTRSLYDQYHKTLPGL